MHTRVEPEEEIIDPHRPIIDPHHHLRDRPGDHYMFRELLDDVTSGHNVVGTVLVECGEFYRDGGPPEMRPVGETEVAAGIAARFDSGKYGTCRGDAGIVAFADLSLGAAVQPVLDAHRVAAGGRLRGIRNPIAWHEHPEFRVTRTGPRERLTDPKFQEGVALLGRNQLVLDAWVYHPQLPDLIRLARACPDTTIVVNHVGGPLGAGPYATRRKQVWDEWGASFSELARCPNVVCKVGGLGMPVIGLGFNKLPEGPTSEVLAQAYRPYIETSLELFGAQRCMFQSNFPPDNVSSTYPVLWNAFKRVAKDWSESDKTALFSGTAASVYRLQHLPGLSQQKEAQQ